IADYISSLYHELEKTGVYSDSGCRELDIILNYKLAEAKERQIQTEISVIVPENTTPMAMNTV
ncbi:MAG: hypothetical protein IKY43_06295, partial [Bacteroidales bacterium]|nr:hypothetical protein [Bacteroidales bacterium]